MNFAHVVREKNIKIVMENRKKYFIWEEKGIAEVKRLIEKYKINLEE